MQTLFNLHPEVSTGVHEFPQWKYVREGLQRNLDTVIAYYQRHPTAVTSSHLVVRLIQSLNTPIAMNIERYYANVDSMAMNLSMAFHLTSSIFKGHLFRGTFYNQDTTEIIIAHSESFDLNEGHRRWWKLRPITVLRHPMSDLKLAIPDGRGKWSESGLAVIMIDLPMLAVQYRAFRLAEQAYTDGNGESQRSVMQFVRMYVLPNMLYSHLDHAVFNRLNNLAIGAPLGDCESKHSFFMPDYRPQVDKVHESIIDYFGKTNLSFTKMLRTIPAVTLDDMDKVMTLPDIPATRQVIWAIAISRFMAIIFLLRESRDGARTQNSAEVNRLLRYLLGYRADSLMRSMLPDSTYYEVEAEIEEIMQLTA